MNETTLYATFYAAFLQSAQELGDDLKNLSCLYSNWGDQGALKREEEREAA